MTFTGWKMCSSPGFCARWFIVRTNGKVKTMLEELKVFMQAAKDGSLGADQSQSLQDNAAAISRLEEELGFLLLETVEPDGSCTCSPAGQYLYSSLLSLQKVWQQNMQQAKELAQKTQPPLRVGFVETLDNEKTAAASSQALASGLEVLHESQEVLYDWLRHNKIDVACLCDAALTSSAYAAMPCVSMDLQALVPSKHPLAKVSAIPLSRLAKEKQIQAASWILQVLSVLYAKRLWQSTDHPNEKAIVIVAGSPDAAADQVLVPLLHENRPVRISFSFYWKPDNTQAALYHFLGSLQTQNQ